MLHDLAAEDGLGWPYLILHAAYNGLFRESHRNLAKVTAIVLWSWSGAYYLGGLRLPLLLLIIVMGKPY